MDLIRTCLICNNHYNLNPEEDGNGLGEEKGWSLFCLLWKLLGISVEGERLLKGVRVNILKGQPWCGECQTVLDDLRRLEEDIEKAKRRQETILEGVKFLVSTNLDKSEHLEEAWTAHRLQLVKYCTGAADEIHEGDDEDQPMALSEGDAIQAYSLIKVEQKDDIRDYIRDCRIRLRRLLPKEYEKKAPVMAGEEDPITHPVKRSSRRKPSKSIFSSASEAEDCLDSDRDFVPDLADKLESAVDEEGQAESEDNHPIYKCRRCKISFNDKPSRAAHYHKIHYNKQFHCEICGKSLKWKNDLKRHILRAHSNPPLPDRRRSAFRKKATAPAPPSYVCEHCGFKCRNKGDFSKHVITHSDLRPFKCEFCDKAFKRKDILLGHEKRMHKEQFEASFIGPKLAFPCEYCDKIFHIKGKLLDHTTSAHWRLFLLNEDGSFKPGVELHECPKEGCDYKHPLKDRVRMHFHLGHKYAESKPFKCQYCGKGFKSIALKNDHELSHVNKESRPFVCEICGKSFAVPKTLYVHKRLSHEGRRFPGSKKGKAASRVKKEELT